MLVMEYSGDVEYDYFLSVCVRAVGFYAFNL